MEAYNNFILSFMYQFMYKHMEFYSISSVAFGNIYQNTQDLLLGEFVFDFAEMNFLYRLRFLFCCQIMYIISLLTYIIPVLPD